MISFLWSTISAIGFMASGFLLRDGELRLSGMAALAAWAWLMFPKIPMWLIGAALRKLNGARAAKTATSGRTG